MHALSQNQILNLLQQLIQIPSINPHLNVDDGSSEMDLALFIQEWLAHHHIQSFVKEVQPGRPNVYAEIGNGNGPTLCFCAHLDTVGVKEMTIDPFGPAVEGNRVYGRGSCDMKGGLAAILNAAVFLSHQKLQGKVILALVCDEEYASIGADDFVQKHQADACILTEPSDLQLVVAHKGFLWGKVTTFGKSAHGSRWDIGESAISKMGHILVKLETFEGNTLRERKDPLVGPASLHISLINGGTRVSTYASQCEIHIERRILPSEDRLNVQEEIEEVINSSGVESQIEWYFYRPPFQSDLNSKIVTDIKQAYYHVMGKEPEQVGWGVWTDAAIFQNAGIPTVNIGPIGFGLHEPIEWVDLHSVVHTATILYHTALSFLTSNCEITTQ